MFWRISMNYLLFVPPALPSWSHQRHSRRWDSGGHRYLRVLSVSGTGDWRQRLWTLCHLEEFQMRAELTLQWDLLRTCNNISGPQSFKINILLVLTSVCAVGLGALLFCPNSSRKSHCDGHLTPPNVSTWPTSLHLWSKLSLGQSKQCGVCPWRRRMELSTEKLPINTHTHNSLRSSPLDLTPSCLTSPSDQCTLGGLHWPKHLLLFLLHLRTSTLDHSTLRGQTPPPLPPPSPHVSIRSVHPQGPNTPSSSSSISTRLH